MHSREYSVRTEIVFLFLSQSYHLQCTSDLKGIIWMEEKMVVLLLIKHSVLCLCLSLLLHRDIPFKVIKNSLIYLFSPQ